MNKGRPQTHILRSLEQTYIFAEQLVKSLLPQAGQATVLLLSGDLGSGKTTFTKGLARGLLVKDSVISPTFILEKKYKIKNNQYFTKLIHIDAYRFDDQEEARVLQLEEELKSKENIIVIEWPEKLGKYRPSKARTILFRSVDENTKEIIC